MSSKKTLLTVGPAPHWRTSYGLARMNYAFIVALLPAIVASVLAQGDNAGKMAAVGLLALGAGLGLLVEYLTQVFFRQPYLALNGHGILMGLLMALFLPVSVPVWVLVIAIICGIVVGKQLFGGIGAYPFHPTMVGLLVVLVSWPHHVFPIAGMTLGASSPLVIYLTAAGGAALVLMGHSRWEAPVAVLAGIFVSAFLFRTAFPEIASPVDQLLTGHVMLAAFFVAADSTSSPVNRIPLIMFGFFVGVMIMLIRVFGIWPDAIPFAVLFMNIVAPLLDRIRPRYVEVATQNG